MKFPILPLSSTKSRGILASFQTAINTELRHHPQRVVLDNQGLLCAILFWYVV